MITQMIRKQFFFLTDVRAIRTFMLWLARSQQLPYKGDPNYTKGIPPRKALCSSCPV